MKIDNEKYKNAKKLTTKKVGHATKTRIKKEEKDKEFMNDFRKEASVFRTFLFLIKRQTNESENIFKTTVKDVIPLRIIPLLGSVRCAHVCLQQGNRCTTYSYKVWEGKRERSRLSTRGYDHCFSLVVI